MAMLLNATAAARDEAEKSHRNSQPFDELASIMQRHRGCGHDCLRLAEYSHDMKEVENAQETSDHDGR
jgi:hypothetical protein